MRAAPTIDATAIPAIALFVNLPGTCTGVGAGRGMGVLLSASMVDALRQVITAEASIHAPLRELLAGGIRTVMTGHTVFTNLSYACKGYIPSAVKSKPGGAL